MNNHYPTGEQRPEQHTPEHQIRNPRAVQANDFPPVAMALRGNLQPGDVDWFTEAMVEITNLAVADLHAALLSEPQHEWPNIFKNLNDQLVMWRCELAAERGTGSSATSIGGLPPQAERFVAPITDESPNVDPVGEVGFWHDGNEFDEKLGRYAGGEETPASRLVAEVGEWVTRRMDEERDSGGVLQNKVRLPNGQLVNGNLLLRGEGAQKQKQIGIERVKAGGIDTDWTEITGNIMYVETGTEVDRQAIRKGLYEYLSQLEVAHQNGEPVTVEQWAEAAYLLYQSPQTKKGSDAVHRVYLMTLASRWMKSSPKMPGDIDWRAYVKGQGRFVDEVAARQSD